ncbi:MAG: type II secretion system F family protein [Pseudomonadota bacterium]
MHQHRPLPLALSALLFQHLAAMEKAGLAPDRSYALLDLGESARERVATFRRLVARGVAPPAAGATSGLFSRFDARLLGAAFSAGSPLPTYQRLASHYATRTTQRMQLRSRMMLPLAVLSIALFVAPLPSFIGGALSLGGYLVRALGPLVLLAVLFGCYRSVQAWFTSGAPGPARAMLDSVLLGLPIFGPMHLRRNARDFFESLALMLHAGLSVLEALPDALATVANGQVRKDLASIQPQVEAGATLADALAGLRITGSAELVGFVLTGEQSGTLAEMLGRYADKETIAVDNFQRELVAWGPRVFYTLVALWMAKQILGPAFG